jgi:RNA polymerase sigma-70 factor (ECF subfamily)
MSNHSDGTTMTSLLGRLRSQPSDQQAWNDFVDRYGPRLYAWARQRGAQDADAQDVVQMVLVKLADRMRTFEYDRSRSFRGYLRTLTQHAWSDLVAARQRIGRGTGDSGVESILDSVEARADLVASLEEAFDLEILEEATTRVRLRVSPHVWQAFHLLTAEGLSGAETAERLGIPVATAFKFKSRVQKLLREVVQSLEETPE